MPAGSIWKAGKDITSFFFRKLYSLKFKTEFRLLFHYLKATACKEKTKTKKITNRNRSGKSKYSSFFLRGTEEKREGKRLYCFGSLVGGGGGGMYHDCWDMQLGLYASIGVYCMDFVVVGVDGLLAAAFSAAILSSS